MWKSSRPHVAGASNASVRLGWRWFTGALLVTALLGVAAAVVAQELDFNPTDHPLGSGAGAETVVTAESSKQRSADERSHASPADDARRHAQPQIVPAPGALKEAWGYAQSRGGEVSIAIVDTRGRFRGEAANRLYSSASVVKSMLLAAELRRLEREALGVDEQTESLLRAMITYSDNDAADAIYSRVGDAGLFEVARLARMKRFTVAGHWGNAQITAADMARMFSDLDRVFAGAQSEFALGLLGSIVDEQRWGIPAAAGDRWAVRFKGGWVMTDHGQITHQAAELRDGDRQLSMAILTDEQPSMAVGTETVRGIAERLLQPSPERDRTR